MIKKRSILASRRFEFRGEMKTVAEIAAISGASECAVFRRIREVHSIQDRERPSTSKTYTFDGKTMTIPAWAKAVGISVGTLRERLVQYRWPVERALTEPVMTMSQQHLRRRNAKLIARMLEGFHAPTTTTSIGGCLQTFHESQGTGPGSSKTDFERASA